MFTAKDAEDVELTQRAHEEESHIAVFAGDGGLTPGPSPREERGAVRRALR
jgi:hypothetical protein